MPHSFPATRTAALRALKDFVPKAGRQYADGRNYDRGPGRHMSVSGLSPYIRRRLITEAEVIREAVGQHGFDTAQKFIQEVVWRGYFKGWLERRPTIWHSYRDGLASDFQALNADRGLHDRIQQAEAGITGIDCFDAWAVELVETGYLHNHARMWFASIWIFTLGLPWRIGADFFLRHLLDGDPASNTLGWRWVAGLHTRGKAYQAMAWNIATYTNHRFTPRDADLADPIRALDWTEPEGLPPVQSVRDVITPALGVPTLLLITEEDCCPDAFDIDALDLRGVATLAASALRSEKPVADLVVGFEEAALSDTAARLGHQARSLEAGPPAELVRIAADIGAAQIATAFVPQGPLRDWLDTAAADLRTAGIDLAEWRRPWDQAIWPHATAGFFKVKKQIPDILRTLEIL